jgi:hypothetical protein
VRTKRAMRAKLPTEIVHDKRGKVLQPALACAPHSKDANYRDANHRARTAASVTRVQLKLLQ